MTEPGTDEDPGPAWLREALRIRGNRGPHLSVPYQEQVIAVARTHAWTYEEALNYIVGVGLGLLDAVAVYNTQLTQDAEDDAEECQ
jgi:hypothetical protein